MLHRKRIPVGLPAFLSFSEDLAMSASTLAVVTISDADIP
jgi:hypothetical protein